MGFELNLALLRPHEEDFGRYDQASEKTKKALPNRKCTIWKAETVLRIGRVSAPVNDKGYARKSARERAALYFVESFYGGLMKYVNTAGTECLAPPFATVRVQDESFPPTLVWERQFVAKQNDRNWFILPISGRSSWHQVPSQDVMLEHNTALQSCKGHAATTDVVMAKPFVWAPSTDVTRWIIEGESSSDFVARSGSDPEARVFFDMWKTCIAEMSKVGYHTLFLFESLQLLDADVI